MQKVKVPKKKCPLDIISEMGEDAKKFRFFMDQAGLDQLRKSADSLTSIFDDSILEWKATDKYPSTKLVLSRSYGKWYMIKEIEAKDIFFRKISKNVEDNIFLEKEA